MKNSVYRLLIIMMKSQHVAWKSCIFIIYVACKCSPEDLFILLSGLVTIEIKVYYDDLNRIYFTKNKPINDKNLEKHKEYDKFALHNVNNNLSLYLSFIEFCITTLIDEDDPISLNSEQLSTLRSKLKTVINLLIEYLDNIYKNKKYEESTFLSYTKDSIRLLGLCIKEAYEETIPEIYNIIPNLYLIKIPCTSPLDDTYRYLIPGISYIADDKEAMTLFLNNKCFERLYNYILSLYNPFLLQYTEKTDDAISILCTALYIATSLIQIYNIDITVKPYSDKV